MNGYFDEVLDHFFEFFILNCLMNLVTIKVTIIY